MSDLVRYVRPAAPSRLVTPADLEPPATSIVEGDYQAYPPVWPFWHILVVVALQAAGLGAVLTWVAVR